MFGSENGISVLAAVVETVKVTAVGVPGVTVALAGAVQVAFEGAPEQAKVTVYAVVGMPPVALSCRA